MSQVDPLFLIGVIREKEKSFLQPDEYTRLAANINAVRDTPYGATLGAEISLASVEAAILRYLHQELTWIRNYLDNDRVLAFMAARYDAINVAAAILQFKQKSTALLLPSSLGSLRQDALFAAIWDNNPKALAGSPWQAVVVEEVAHVREDGWLLSQLLGRMAGHYTSVLNQLAFTPLSAQIATIASHRLAADAALRFGQATALPEMSHQLEAWGHGRLTADTIAHVHNQTSATAYELAWDAEIMAAISPYRFHVDGYDPVIAYWWAKQIESQSVRLIVAGTLAGLSPEAVAAFTRPYYQPKFV